MATNNHKINNERFSIRLVHAAECFGYTHLNSFEKALRRSKPTTIWGTTTARSLLKEIDNYKKLVSPQS